MPATDAQLAAATSAFLSAVKDKQDLRRQKQELIADRQEISDRITGVQDQIDAKDAQADQLRVELKALLDLP